MQLTKNQEAAVMALGQNVVVSASAGAGKTAVLVERLAKRVIQDGLSMDQICALTFTKKAAQEMKQRLAQKLDDYLAQDPTNTHLKDQVVLVSASQISTIHSFCNQIIKDFGYLLGLSNQMASSILDDEMALNLKNRAFNTALASFTDAQVLAHTLFYLSSQDSMASLKAKVFEFLTILAVQEDPEKFLSIQKNRITASSFSDLDPDFISMTLTMLKTILMEAHQEYMALVDMGLDEAFQNHWTPAFEDCFLALQNKDLDNFRQAAYKLLDGTLPSLRAKPAQGQDEGWVKQFNTLRNNLLERFNNNGSIQDFFLLTEPFLNPLSQEVGLFFLDLSVKTGEIYQQLKREEETLDFSDLEVMAYQILNHANPVARNYYQHQLQEILVDEFQDTNPLQDAIIQAISNGHNIFRVGDVKQSIYGFRYAKPQLMQDLINDPNNNLIISLTDNFRSSHHIIDFTNDLFKVLLNISGVDSPYLNQDLVQVGSGQQKDSTSFSYPLVQNIWVNKDIKEITRTWPDGKSDTQPVNESMRIAWAIGLDIQQKIQQDKNLSYRDICVLIRSHHRKKDLKKVFDQLNIPYYFDDREGFYHASVVQDIRRLLKLSLKDHSDETIAWILLSAYGRYSPQDVAKLRLYKPSQSLWTNLKEYDPDLFLALKNLEDQAQKESLVKVVNSLIHFRHTYRYLDIQDQTNLDLLREKAYQFSQHNPSLSAFCHHLTEMIDLETNNPTAVSSDGNVVKVMTIHQSKGLQFPLVYLFSSQLKNRKNPGRLFLDKDFGLALLSFDPTNNIFIPTLLSTSLSCKDDFDQASEYLRLLYVALTRPQKQLVLVHSQIPTDEEKIGTLSYLDLISTAGFSKIIAKTLDNHPSNHAEDSYIESFPSIQARASDRSFFTPPRGLEKPLVTKADVSVQAISLNLNQQAALWYGSDLHLRISKALLDTNKRKDFPIFFSLDLVKKWLTYDEVHSEVSFLSRDDQGQVRHQIIDALFINHQTKSMVLLDFKTDRCSLEELKTRYQPQLDRYQDGLEKLKKGYHIDRYLYSFHHQVLVPLDEGLH